MYFRTKFIKGTPLVQPCSPFATPRGCRVNGSLYLWAKRNDCRQVAVGMAFDEHGLPLAHEVFEGNMADTKTLEVVLGRLEVPDAGLKPVVILDAGFASAANIALLKARGYSYLINITRGSRAKYAEVFEKEIFQELPGRAGDQKVEVRKIADPFLTPSSD